MSSEKSSEIPKKKKRMGAKTAFGLGFGTGLGCGVVLTLVYQDVTAEQAETEPSASGSKATGT